MSFQALAVLVDSPVLLPRFILLASACGSFAGSMPARTMLLVR